MIVVDASVAAKWFLPELDSCEAERLRSLLVEVAAAISRRNLGETSTSMKPASFARNGSKRSVEVETAPASKRASSKLLAASIRKIC
jgi:predicted nucleic acid-binding protein